jgi:hypothetical protein
MGIKLSVVGWAKEGQVWLNRLEQVGLELSKCDEENTLKELLVKMDNERHLDKVYLKL